MIVRTEPVTAIIVAVLLGWDWVVITDSGHICMVKQRIDGGEMYKPVKCSDIEGVK